MGVSTLKQTAELGKARRHISMRHKLSCMNMVEMKAVFPVVISHCLMNILSLYRAMVCDPFSGLRKNHSVLQLDS